MTLAGSGGAPGTTGSTYDRVPLPPEYRPRTAPALLAQRAAEAPGAIGFVARFGAAADYRSMTRADWYAASGAVAAGLRSTFGIGVGSKVAWVLDNQYGGDALVLYHALHRLGAVNVPVNPRSAVLELEHILRHSGSSLCVFGAACADRALPAATATVGRERAVVVGTSELDVTCLEDVLRSAEPDGELGGAAVAEDDVAALLYTSGTTGRPKGVVLTHGNAIAAGIAWADAFRLVPDDVFHAPFPVFAGAGLHYTAMAALWAEATCVVDHYNTDRTLTLLEEQQTTVFAAVPSIYQFLLESPRLREVDTSHVRVLAYGGASMPSPVIRGLKDAFPLAGLMQTYGLTEAGPGGTYLPEEYALRFLGSIGIRTAGRFTSMRIIDESGRDVGPGEPGELVLRGPSVMRGYHDDPEATAAAIPDGWLRTGDVVRFDEYGAMYHLDRKKDIIIRGGLNVASVEVESALLEHPAVLDAAVVGVPHERLGEAIVAVVVLRPGQPPGRDELLSHCRSRVADFKVPTRIQVRDSLPRNAAGKVRKHELRDELLAGEVVCGG